MDNWKHRSEGMLCKSCMFFAPKAKEGEIIEVGRCRKHAPTMGGWPVMFITDWCGDHKLDETKLLKPRKDYFCVKPEDLIQAHKFGRIS